MSATTSIELFDARHTSTRQATAANPHSASKTFSGSNAPNGCGEGLVDSPYLGKYPGQMLIRAGVDRAVPGAPWSTHWLRNGNAMATFAHLFVDFGGVRRG